MGKFTATMGKGVYLEFDNGYVISAQWGYMNYCENYMKSEKDLIGKRPSEIRLESETCEIAIWDKNGEWITKDILRELGEEEIYDDVLGYVTMNKFLKIVNYLNEKGEEC